MRHTNSAARRRVWLLCAVTVSLLTPAWATAQSKLPAESLNWVPADAAFYSASLRGREQLEIIANSKAWQRLKSMPAVQMALQMADAQIGQEGGPLDMAKAMIELPENQELLALFGEMFSEESFMYADGNTTEVLELVFEAINGAQYAPLVERARGEENVDEETAQARAFLDTLAENSDKIHAPNVLFGFKIEDEKRAQTQIKRLEVLAGLALKRQPEFKDRLKREDVAGASFLTFHIDGSLIPWDEVPWEKVEAEEGEYDQIREKLEEATLDISLGVLNGYLLLSMGESNEQIEKLGQGELLASRAELKPLLAAGDKRYTSINYVSEEFLQAIATTPEDVQELAKMAEFMLAEAELPEELEKRILEDADELAEDLSKVIPEVGAILQYSFLTSRGTESFTHNWTEQPYVDASKPLTLLNHVGGAPLLAAVTRGKPSPESYDTLVKWLKKGYGYYEEFGKPQIPEERREMAEKIEELLLPLAERADETTREKLMPALADGQLGLVLDAEWTSKQWHKEMEAADEPLPMLEVGIVAGVSDAELLKQALNDYRKIVNEALAGVKEIDPNAEEVQVPSPKSKSASEGSLYWYPLPDEIGLDDQVQPTLGISEDVVALSLSQGHTTRLLSNSPLKAGGLLKTTDRKLGSAAFFDWAGLMGVVEQWVDYGSGVAMEQDTGAAGQIGFIMQNVKIGFELLRTLRTVTSISYPEGDAWVTHTETHWQDVK